MVDANNIAANRPEETQETVKKQGYFGPNLVFLFFSIFFSLFDTFFSCANWHLEAT